MPDRARGEVPVAFVVAPAGDAFDAAALEALAASQLASFKVPRAYVRVDALPRTALGKVQKHLLPCVDGRLMNPAVASLAALGCRHRPQPVVAHQRRRAGHRVAWLVGVAGAGWKAEAVMAAFPASLFLTLPA